MSSQPLVAQLWPLAALLAVGCGDAPPVDAPLPFEVRALDVPLDPSGGDAARIPLRYFYANGTEDPAPPVLVFLFGGPGSSAVSFMPYVQSILPSALTERFALVGLDEVGVGSSVPISLACPDLLADADEAFQHPFLTSSAEARAATWETSTTECYQNYRYADLLSADRHARDLERLRAALGAERLHFVAYSYGGRVALQYAALFPEQTGHLVLDSVVDPRASYLEVLRAQAMARADMLNQFLAWCEAEPGRCGFTPQDVLQTIDDLQVMSASAAIRFLILLGDLIFEPHWPQIAEALATVLADPEGTLADSDARVVAAPAFVGNVCADNPAFAQSDIEAAEAAFFDALDDPLPEAFFADTFNGAFGCLFWPSRTSTATWAQAIEAQADRLEPLIVTSRGDPKSPAVLADTLAEDLALAHRVQVDEVSHALGLQGVNACVDEAVTAYLLDAPVRTSSCAKTERPE